MHVPALQSAEQLVNESIRRSDRAHLVELRKAINQYAALAKALKLDQYIRSLGDMITLLVKYELTSTVVHASCKSSSVSSRGHERGKTDVQ